MPTQVRWNSLLPRSGNWRAQSGIHWGNVAYRQPHNAASVRHWSPFHRCARGAPWSVASVRDSDHVDLVVLISHYGFAQEVAIAGAVDGIDVILGGHTGLAWTT